MKRSILPLVALVIGCAGTVHAELTPEQTKTARALIAQFSDRRFAARQQAVDKLVVMGPDVLPLVRKTLAGTKDAEVKLRCRMVLDGIGRKHGIAVTPEGPAPETLAVEASRVTIKLTDVTLDQALRALAEQSGNKPVTQPKNWGKKTVSLSVTDMPYWQALDAVCRQHRLTYIGSPLRLVRIENGTDISAYTGPVVVKVVRGTRRNEFLRFQGPRHNALSYDLSYRVEDRLQPLSMGATITRAVAPGGKELTLPARPGKIRLKGMVSGHVPWGSISVQITDVPEDLRKIARLDGTVRMRFSSGKRVLRIKDVFGEGERKAEDDDTVLRVERTRHERDRERVTITLRQTQDGEDVSMPAYPGTSDYGYELIHPDGKRHRKPLIGSTGRFLRGMGHVKFYNLPDIKGKWTLVYTVPLQTVEKTFDFTIKDIPLP